MLKLAMFGLDMADRTSRALSANSQAALDIQGLNAQIANQKKQKLQADETLYAQLDVAQDDYEYSTDEVFDKVQKVKEKAVTFHFSYFYLLFINYHLIQMNIFNQHFKMSTYEY